MSPYPRALHALRLYGAVAALVGDARTRLRAMLSPMSVRCLGCGSDLGDHTREEMEACKAAVTKGWGDPLGDAYVAHLRARAAEGKTELDRYLRNAAEQDARESAGDDGVPFVAKPGAAMRRSTWYRGLDPAERAQADALIGAERAREQAKDAAADALPDGREPLPSACPTCGGKLGFGTFHGMRYGLCSVCEARLLWYREAWILDPERPGHPRKPVAQDGGSHG